MTRVVLYLQAAPFGASGENPESHIRAIGHEFCRPIAHRRCRPKHTVDGLLVQADGEKARKYGLQTA